MAAVCVARSGLGGGGACARARTRCAVLMFLRVRVQGAYAAWHELQSVAPPRTHGRAEEAVVLPCASAWSQLPGAVDVVVVAYGVRYACAMLVFPRARVLARHGLARATAGRAVADTRSGERGGGFTSRERVARHVAVADKSRQRLGELDRWLVLSRVRGTRHRPLGREVLS